MRKCATKYCKNNRGRCRYCNTCSDRRKREKNPLRYAYDNLKHNTYRRKGRHFFELTFDEFKKFAIETKYIQGAGRSRTSYSIDRIDNSMGYFVGNIRVITISENSRKATKTLVYDWESGYAEVTSNIPRDKSPDPSLPF